MRLTSKDLGRERSGQKARVTRQVWTEEMNVSEPSSYNKHRKRHRRHQNQGLWVLLGSVRRPPILPFAWCPVQGRHEFSLGFYTELEKLQGDVKGKRTSEKPSLGRNTDAPCSGGLSRSSDEAV